MKVICIRLNSGEEIIGKLVEDSSASVLMGSNTPTPFDGTGPFLPAGNVTLEKIQGITAQPVSKTEMGIAFFPWSLGNTDGKFTFILDNCAAAVYLPDSTIEAGYLEQAFGVKLARATPGMKM